MRGFRSAMLGVMTVVMLGTAAPVPSRPVKDDEVLLAEMSVPPPGLAEPGKPSKLRITIGETTLRLYPDAGKPQEKLREAIRETQLLLWATSGAATPKALQNGVKSLRGKSKGMLPAILRMSWPIPRTPAGERALKNSVYTTSRDLAKHLYVLEQHLERLEKLQPLRDKECKRWQANYDLMRAWVMLRIIHLEEVSKALGQLRKELPEHDEQKDKTFHLAAREQVADIVARKMVKPTEKILDRIIKDYPDTVWSDLAAGNRVKSLGVEWVTTR